MRLKQGISMTLGGSLGVMAVFGFVMMVLSVVPAAAADKGGPNFLEIPGATPKSPWTGLGVSVYGSMLDADIAISPFTFGSDGNEAGIGVSYDVAMGAFLVGVGAEYGRVFGDLNTIGLDAAMALYGKVGVFATPSTLIYMRGGRSRLDTTAGNLDGWQWGPGVEVKMPTAPLFFRLEHLMGNYNLGDIGGPPIDADMNVTRFAITYKFN